MNRTRPGHTYANSGEAVAGSRRLLEDVRNGLIPMDNLPNTAEDFTGKEENDYFISFLNFMDSYNAKFVQTVLEEAGER